MCVASDHQSHYQSTFHAFLASALYPLSKKLHFVKKVVYFSDVQHAASQYKNYKAFINICFYQQDHNLKAEWCFFLQQVMGRPYVMELEGL